MKKRVKGTHFVEMDETVEHIDSDGGMSND